MALSQAEKKYVLDMLDNMDRGQAQAVLSSKNSFSEWLKNAARWLWDRVIANIDKVIAVIARVFLGW